MEIYNTLTRKKETFKPRDPEGKKVQMFVCGPTVYDYIHIGNARTFVIFDVVAKYLRYKGYDVTYIQNITDIDDKIIQRAHDEDTTPEKLAKQYTKAFLEDMTALGVDFPKYAKATEYIPQIIAQVEKLISRGYAYAVPALEATGPGAVKGGGYKDVYFDIEKYEKDFPGQYGKLSGQVIDNLEAEKRVEMEKNKQHPRDFVLWKAQNYSYDWVTDSPWGKGRPGWHIEDTAITEAEFKSPQYDIHGGGQDLKFPHHEAEIAQQCAAAVIRPKEFVKYWMHSGFLINKAEKMSKSLGNFATLNELLKKYQKQYLRYYLLSGHYRQPLEYNEEGIQNLESTLSRLSNYYDQLKKIRSETPDNFSEIIKTKVEEFHSAMDDDFNTPSALASIFELISETYQQVFEGRINKSSAQDIINFLDKINSIFSIVIPPEKQKEANKIDELRKRGEFKEATKKREEIVREGYIVQTSVLGTTIIPGIEIKKIQPEIKIHKKGSPE